jgi:hypothetical protein
VESVAEAFIVRLTQCRSLSGSRTIADPANSYANFNIFPLRLSPNFRFNEEVHGKRVLNNLFRLIVAFAFPEKSPNKSKVSPIRFFSPTSFHPSL